MLKEKHSVLPQGWEWRTIGDIYEVIGGGTPSTAIEEYWTGDIPWITSADIYDLKDIRPRKNITKKAIESSATNLVPAGVIIVVTRVSLGKVALTSYPLCFSQDSQALVQKGNHILPEYSLYYLSLATKSFKQQSRGTTISGVTKKQLKDLLVPLPPLPEQERIVERIESLFTQLDAGVSALKRARAALKRYKASVLKAACEGRLVAQDLNDEPAEELLRRILAERAEKYVPPNGELAKLPEGWCWASEQQIADTIGGITKGRNFKGKRTVLLPYLRVANVQRGRLDLREMKEIELLEEEIDKYKLLEGDIVLTEGGDWDKLGRSAIWENNLPLCVHQNHIFRARLKSRAISNKWIMYYTNSEQGQNYFKDASKQTTNLASINLTQLRSCPIPIPPVDEQKRIVAEIERRLSVVQELEQTIEANLRRAGRLRQAILKRAFEGRLV